MTLGADSQGLGETASGTVVQTAFYLHKGEKIVSSNFWAKTLVLKVFVNLHDLMDSKQNLISFFQRTFGSVVKAAFKVSRWIICEKISRGKKSFEIDKVRGCLLKNLGQLSQSFRQFRQNCILTVESRSYGEIFIVRTLLFGKFFRILGEKMSSYMRNCFCKSVRTAFYVNKRKAFLSILMRVICFPKCL